MNEHRVIPRQGIRCPRCGHHHWALDTTVCQACWVDLGQMELWEDVEEEEDVDPRDPAWDRDDPF